jgi:benzoyl-CoA reductase subunit C
MDALEKFHDVVVNHHKYALEWKEKTGGKVVGCLSNYCPEEIMYAAGLLPVRVVGSREPTDITQTHVSNRTCVYARDILAQGLLGRYDYLDGIVLTHGCQMIQLMFHSWRLHVPTPYKNLVYFPTLIRSRGAKSLITANLKAFGDSLGEWLGKPITVKQLDNAIKVYNTNRGLLRQLYDLRKDSPSISGAETLEVTLAGTFMDKKEHSALLQQLLKELPKRNRRSGADKRLLIAGSELDDVELVKIIESLGAVVVTDDIATGSRSIWTDVIPQEDRYEAIATRLITRPPDASKDVPDRLRVPHILKLVKDFRVDGVVILQNKFCDTYQWDNPALMAALTEGGIPNLRLETDIVNPPGPFRTRVEAFIETLEPGLYKGG